MGWLPSYQSEARVYAKYLIEHDQNGKIRRPLSERRLRQGLSKGTKRWPRRKISIISKQAYETTDATINSQIFSLKNSGAHIFFNVTTPKFAAQAITKIAEIGWQLIDFSTIRRSQSAACSNLLASKTPRVFYLPHPSRTQPTRFGKVPRPHSMVRFHGPIFSRRRSYVEFYSLWLQRRANHGTGPPTMR